MEFNRFLKKQWFPLVTRMLGLFSFILLIILLFYGSLNILSLTLTGDIAMIIIWILWWPLLYITLLFFGRLWCGFLCPLSLANEAGNYVRKGAVINFRKWGFVPYAVFFMVVYFEQVSGLFTSVSMTLLFFVLSFGAAFILGMILQRFSFCKLICPIGTLLGVFSRLSFMGLRTKKHICKTCKEKYCLLGNNSPPCPMFNNVPDISSSKDCLLCTNCIKNCPHGSAKIGFLRPGAEIVQKSLYSVWESLFIISLLGMTAILTTNGTMFMRVISGFAGFSYVGAALRAADFIISIGLFVLIYAGISLACSRLEKKGLKETITDMGYIYLPIVFMIMFFLIVFGFLGPWIPLEELEISLVKYAILSVGIAWSIVLLYKTVLKVSRGLAGKVVALLHLMFLVSIGALWLFLLIPGPLNAIPVNENVAYVLPGEVVDMKVFGMGYDPGVIIAEKGVQVNLNITNIDINHAFDVDEMNVHYVFRGGSSTLIMFTPDKAGTFEFYCSLPGHKEAGMKGKLIVKEKEAFENA